MQNGRRGRYLPVVVSILLLVLYAGAAGLLLRWGSGEIAFRRGYPRAWGQLIAATGGCCLITRPIPPKRKPGQIIVQSGISEKDR